MSRIDINNLRAGYGHSFTLQDIDLNFPEGKITCIIGPNGSGKTTLLRAISRVIKPDQGSVALNGKNIWDFTIDAFARSVAVVSQSIEIDSITLQDYVLLGRTPHRRPFQWFESNEDLAIAEKYMRLTDIYPIRHKYLGEVSGGERQLAQAARALAQEPKLLLLDEPTSHLDIGHQAAMLDLIRRFNRTMGLSIIIVLHDLNLASEYCDNIVLLHNGRLEASGTPREVLTYQRIESVYQTVVLVNDNPLSGKPYVMLVSEEERLASPP